MLAFVFASAISLALAAVAQASPPRRVASLNLCTDELLLTLAGPGQILSVTHLSQQEAETPLWRQAARYPRNDGSLASVAGRRPDLVLTMGGGARDRARIAERLGIRILDLPFARSLADVEANVRTVAGALGRASAGAPVVERLRRLRQGVPARTIEAVWLGGGGRTVAADGLEAHWMRLAGLRQRSVQGDRISLEQLVARPPAVLLRSDYRQGQYSAAQRWLHHPLAGGTGRSRNVATDGRPWTCMGPPMIDEVLRLRSELGA
ncbi:ABC transporter substrate-binding protein [Allosphingosinicella sp.]|jgi:iron complex transport system substrate-binding protein|uniref:ABC transporter substrate-binding protein n=1 Tax=Allosphingosinicella sp. TaxID=2823234 RepID=UPI002EEED836